MADQRENFVDISTAAPADRMGSLELAVYKSDWMSSRVYLRHVADVAARRQLEAAAQAAQDQIMKAAGVKPGRSEPAGAGRPASRGFVTLRKSIPDNDEGDRTAERDVEAPTPGRIAARLLLARLFDRNPAVMQLFLTASPVVVVDVPDRALHSRIAHQWKAVLSLDHLRFVDIAQLSDRAKREDHDAIHAVFNDPLSLKDRPAADTRAFAAIQLALPILAITPSAETHLSKVLLDAATHRLTLPAIDAALINRVVRIVTGKRCTKVLPEGTVAHIGLHELLLAVRFDRTPAQCVGNLLQMAQAKTAKMGSRDLSLDELHGLDEAVEWAKSTILDIEAWKRGEIAWDAIDAGVVLDGPPGTGKTLFAKLASESMKIPMLSATLAKWQGSGEGHLGHLLRAMKKDFDEARAKAPAVFFIDELDSFPNRTGVTHSHKDYVVEVVNAFVEQLDGLQGRQGLIFIGATNDVGRCDPAIVRAGRLNRIIKVRLPSPVDIEKMMRVRLRGDLQNETIEEISLLAIGSSGADVERIVKDARRYARQQERVLSVKDLRQALLGSDNDLSPEMVERAAAHEAGHIIIAVIQGGPADIHAVVAGARSSAGFVASKNRGPEAGTLAEYRQTLQGLLAGRAAEELLIGAAGSGSGLAQGSDLALATRIAAALVGSIGHAGPHPLLFLADHRQTDAIMDHAYMRAAAHEELAAAFQEAKRILAEHREALKEVAAQLRLRGRLDGFEVAEILGRPPRDEAPVPTPGGQT
jgi:cell division protease FtsH